MEQVALTPAAGAPASMWPQARPGPLADSVSPSAQWVNGGPFTRDWGWGEESRRELGSRPRQGHSLCLPVLPGAVTSHRFPVDLCVASGVLWADRFMCPKDHGSGDGPCPALNGLQSIMN